MEKNIVKAWKIVGSDSYMIGENEMYYGTYFVNGMSIPNQKRALIVSKEDVITRMDSGRKLSHYARGEEIMSVHDFSLKPTRYDEDTTDEETLRRIANKKEMEGFSAVYVENEHEPVEIEVFGAIQDTKSKFITCIPSTRLSNKSTIYFVDYLEIALDEYLKLADKYVSHAAFEKPDRKYLRFVKINRNYAFNDSYPFNDNAKNKSYLTLGDALEEEKGIRKAVLVCVKRQVFKDTPNLIKVSSILTRSKEALKAKTLKDTNLLLKNIISDLQEYTSLCE